MTPSKQRRPQLSASGARSSSRASAREPIRASRYCWCDDKLSINVKMSAHGQGWSRELTVPVDAARTDHLMSGLICTELWTGQHYEIDTAVAMTSRRFYSEPDRTGNALESKVGLMLSLMREISDKFREHECSSNAMIWMWAYCPERTAASGASSPLRTLRAVLLEAREVHFGGSPHKVAVSQSVDNDL